MLQQADKLGCRKFVRPRVSPLAKMQSVLCGIRQTRGVQCVRKVYCPVECLEKCTQGLLKSDPSQTR